MDAESLRAALVRQVHQRVLNRLQADDGTPWADIKKRLQKEFGDGRWTPEEDVLHLFRLTRGRQQRKGEFAAQLMRKFQGVIDKYRETLTGPEAAAKIAWVESVAVVQLGEAVGKTLSGSLVELANGFIDAAGRGEEEEAPRPRPREWRGEVRRRDDGQRERETRPSLRRERPGERRRMAPPPTQRPGLRRREERRCYACGQQGHLQSKCAKAKCFECGTPGHMARSCPYMSPRHRNRDEPMEINHHLKVNRRQATRTTRASDRDEATTVASGSEGPSSRGDTSEEDETSQTYATVVRKRSAARGMGRRDGGQQE